MENKKKPFISVIIDNYNYARFLPDAINSVLEQDYTDFEVIVVDDASTDHSREVINAYADKVKAIFMEKNRGQGAAFNAGFAASQGEIICLLDADDGFLPGKLARIAKAARKHPDATLIYHRAYYSDGKSLANKGELFPKKMWRGNLKKIVIQTSETLFPPTSQLSFRRSFLQKVLPLPPFLNRIDADFPLQMLAGIMGKVVAIATPLSMYRIHGDNWFSSDEFVKLDLVTLWHLMRRTEKAFHFVNNKLEQLGITERIDLMRHRFYRRNVFIFNRMSWWKYLSYSFTNRNFENIFDRIQYIKFGIVRHREFLALSGQTDRATHYPWD